MSRNVVNFESIVSKIVAGGLTAGIFLFWWPTHFATDGIQPLILRGLLSTLFFELVLLSLAPLEARATERLQHRTAERRTRVRARLESAPEHARTGGMVALACLSVGAPLTLLLGAPHQLVKKKPERVEVVRQVVVEKPVVKREVIVKRVTVPGAAAPAGAQTGPTPVPERVTSAPAKAAAKRTTAQAKRPKRAASRAPSTTKPTTKQTTASEPVTAPGAPAATSDAAPAPTSAAPPATSGASAGAGTGSGAAATTGAEQPAPAAQP